MNSVSFVQPTHLSIFMSKLYEALNKFLLVFSLLEASFYLFSNAKSSDLESSQLFARVEGFLVREHNLRFIC